MWLEFSVVSDCFLYQLYLPDAGGFLITPSACWISILIVSSWFRTSFTSLISVQPSCSTTSSPPPSSYMTTAVFLVSYEILAVWISQTVSREGQNCVWKRGIISWGEFRHHYRLGAVFFFFFRRHSILYLEWEPVCRWLRQTGNKFWMPTMWRFTERKTPSQANKFYTSDRAQQNATEEHVMQQETTVLRLAQYTCG